MNKIISLFVAAGLVLASVSAVSCPNSTSRATLPNSVTIQGKGGDNAFADPENAAGTLPSISLVIDLAGSGAKTEESVDAASWVKVDGKEISEYNIAVSATAGKKDAESKSETLNAVTLVFSVKEDSALPQFKGDAVITIDGSYLKSGKPLTVEGDNRLSFDIKGVVRARYVEDAAEKFTTYIGFRGPTSIDDINWFDIELDNAKFKPIEDENGLDVTGWFKKDGGANFFPSGIKVVAKNKQDSENVITITVTGTTIVPQDESVLPSFMIPKACIEELDGENILSVGEQGVQVPASTIFKFSNAIEFAYYQEDSRGGLTVTISNGNATWLDSKNSIWIVFENISGFDDSKFGENGIELFDGSALAHFMGNFKHMGESYNGGFSAKAVADNETDEHGNVTKRRIKVTFAVGNPGASALTGGTYKFSEITIDNSIYTIEGNRTKLPSIDLPAQNFGLTIVIDN